MFADQYLNKNRPPILIPDIPCAGVGICVVIPCLREDGILQTLESLVRCNLPETTTEVFIVINHSEVASIKTKNINDRTKKLVSEWISENNKERLKFFVVGPLELPKKWAGAGLARKRGMDEAVRRFNTSDKKDGIIVSLDADTLVDSNYLTAVQNHFKEHPKDVGATIDFQHQTIGLDPKHLEGIRLYEKYLWYYKEALRFAGYPYSMFTVGSAFVVKAEAYVKRGGMNRRQAGEDFYFLQNLVQLGKVGEITKTKVHPSARLSDRVPFGTGPILQKWLNEEEDLEITYNFEAFKDLKELFDVKANFFQITKNGYLHTVIELPKPVSEFIMNDNFWADLEDLNKNCSSIASYQNRFFQKFNAFKVLKFLNYGHEKYYKKANLKEQIKLLKQYI